MPRKRNAADRVSHVVALPEQLPRRMKFLSPTRRRPIHAAAMMTNVHPAHVVTHREAARPLPDEVRAAHDDDRRGYRHLTLSVLPPIASPRRQQTPRAIVVSSKCDSSIGGSVGDGDSEGRNV